MAITKPTVQYQIKRYASNYLDVLTYTGSVAKQSSQPRLCRFDIGLKNRNVSNGTIDVYWEFGAGRYGTSGADTNFWNLWGMGYQIGDTIVPVSGSSKQNFHLCSLDYQGNITHTYTNPSGAKYTVYRLIASGMFTLKCNADGSFSFPIYGQIKFGSNSNISTLDLTTVTLPEEYNTPRAYVWNGTAWVPGSAYVWNGTAWVPGNAKAWDGTRWLP